MTTTQDTPTPTYLRRGDIRELFGLKSDASVTDWYKRGKIPKPHLIIGLKPVWIAERFHLELYEIASVKGRKGAK